MPAQRAKSIICRAIPQWTALFTLAIASCLSESEPELSSTSSEITTTSTTYRGWNRWTGACNANAQLDIYEPALPGRYPVFLYAVGTGALVSSAEGQLAAQEMAKRGFVSAVVSYDTLVGFSCDAMQAKASCAFSGLRLQSAVAVLCRRGKADCNRGILAGGLSQGASLAVLGANVEPRIRAEWVMGFGGGALGTATQCYVDGQTRLPATRLRVVNGRHGQSQPIANLDAATGMFCSGASSSCLRSNGSGWVLVEDADVDDGHADHCYFVGADANGNEVGCTTSPASFDSSWAPPAAEPWSLATNLDWLAQFADR